MLAPTRYKFTVRDYHRMGKAGILTPDDRVELIEGEIILMPPISGPHQSRTDRLTRTFSRVAGDRAIVRIQGPIRLSEYSEPEPELALLRPREDFYESGHPGPADVFLVVEVSLTTLAFDRGRKLRMYARHGIPEVWILNLRAMRIEVYREPQGDGYRYSEIVLPGGSIAPLAFPDLQLTAAELLGVPA